MRIVFGENYPTKFLESYPKAIHIFLDSGVRIDYPKISGESECLLYGEFKFSEVMAYNIYISAVRKLNFEFGLKNSQHVVDFSEL